MRPLLATLDLAAIRHNHALVQRCAPGRGVFAVVAANAYGHGLAEVVTGLHDQADGFAVASLDEAAQVRALHAGARILLQGGCFTAQEYRLAVQLRLDVVLHAEWQAEQLLETELARPLDIWLALDSGVHQLGFSAAALRDWYARLQGSPAVASLNLLSELSCAGLRNHPLTEAQVEAFAELLDLPFAARTLADSAATLLLPAAHLDWLRPGLMLYGASPFADLSAAELGLRPAMQLQAQIIACREVACGESLGPDGAWTAPRPSRIATVSCGYGDGYPAQAASGTPAWLRGQRVSLVGRVGMDVLSLDVTQLPDVQIGDTVQLWGPQLPVEEVARAVGSDPRALLSQLTARVARRYLA
ncbi:alanine racemase [Pseudomonas cuatrocienegasensis]|uniref:Alanine racemase n=1 Tax=Pseudomonas cuatrocienegasensis TaxID=543360 RepID=A0ABY1BGR3_9PSED|nr:MULTISPECIES: alanine racemase [Pseudomonas]OEC34276.1 alanine racemase [Pseudomonas sp. 21C1]SEQ82586.1 alanine racemase [Pseudomonas cuatrocienegasensis]